MPIRAARFEDAQQIAEVHVASWRVAYRGILSDSLPDSLSVEAWMERWRERLSRVSETTNLVLALGESLIGLAAAGPARDLDCDPLRTQEVYAIYLRSEYWGEGHGKELYLARETRCGGGERLMPFFGSSGIICAPADFTRRKGSRWINRGLSKITTAILP